MQRRKEVHVKNRLEFTLTKELRKKKDGRKILLNDGKEKTGYSNIHNKLVMAEPIVLWGTTKT